jgi:hypothetical protein
MSQVGQMSDAQMRILVASMLSNYVTSTQLNSWMSDPTFTSAVRQAVRDENMWNDYYARFAKRDLMTSVQKEVDGIQKKVKESMKAQMAETLKPHLDTFKDAIPGHVARSMVDQASGFFNSHSQTKELLSRIMENLEAKSKETLDRVVQDEKYHEMTRRLELAITARGHEAVNRIQAESKTQFQRQNEEFALRLNDMQEQVTEKTQALDNMSKKLNENEKITMSLKNNLWYTQICLTLATMIGVGVIVSKI